MKKLNKKLFLTLTVLATPFVAENISEENVAKANATYNLSQSTKVYSNAQNAAKQTNASKTYASGKYYIYKQYNGMINISKTPGKAGGWINPNATKPVVQKPVKTTTTKSSAAVTKTSSIKSTQKPAETSVKTATKPATTKTESVQTSTVTGTYVLNNAVNAYSNANSALNKTNAKTTYAAGNYYIYKTYNGMYNISRTKGRVGAWINPAENKTVVAKPVETPKVQVKPTQKPAEATKAEMKQVQKPAEAPKTEVKQVQKPAEAPKTEVKSTQKPAEAPKTETKSTPKIEVGAVYNLSSKTSAYTNAALAASKTGATREYDKGQYYIYKIYNGMINISKTKGKVGAWINPTAVTTSEKTSNTTASKEEKKVENTLKVLPFANTNYKITSPYGVARNISSIGVRDVHNGVDFVTGNNKEEILSTEAGTVIGSGLSPYGDGAYYVTIKHSDNSYTSYWHLAKNSITVKNGQEVKAGQKIGVIGTTGLSTGIHLHFMHATDSNIFSSHQDPIKYLQSLSK